MKIAITGVNGFIASNLAEYFIRNTDHEVVGISKHTHASFAHSQMLKLEKESDRFKYATADLVDATRLIVLLDKENPDIVIHLSAEADVSRSFDYPFDYLNTNVKGTINLLEWLRDNNDKRMIHFSTDEVFGEPNHRSKEEEKLHPMNLYSASKAAAEQYVNAYNSKFDTDVRMVRPVNNYGPYQGTNRLIAKTIIRCLEDDPFYLFAETQKHTRWWIYVEDTCRAVDCVMNKGKPKESYNITSDVEMGVEETVMKILDIFGKRNLFKGYSQHRPKDDENYALDGAKLKALGWKEKYTFDEGLAKSIQWYRDNLTWFERK